MTAAVTRCLLLSIALHAAVFAWWPHETPLAVPPPAWGLLATETETPAAQAGETVNAAVAATAPPVPLAAAPTSPNTTSSSAADEARDDGPTAAGSAAATVAAASGADDRLSDIHLVASTGHAVLDRAALRSLAEVRRLDDSGRWLSGSHFDMVLPIQYHLIDGRRCMGYRLSKIYTRTGDQGSTSLGNGERVDKDDARVEAFGTVDELNSVLGMLLAHELPETMRSHLTRVQHDLFEVGGELCTPGHTMIKPAACDRLEQVIAHFTAGLPPLKEFILPGGTATAAACHLARAVCL